MSLAAAQGMNVRQNSWTTWCLQGPLTRDWIQHGDQGIPEQLMPASELEAAEADPAAFLASLTSMLPDAEQSPAASQEAPMDLQPPPAPTAAAVEPPSSVSTGMAHMLPPIMKQISVGPSAVELPDTSENSGLPLPRTAPSDYYSQMTSCNFDYDPAGYMSAPGGPAEQDASAYSGMALGPEDLGSAAGGATSKHFGMPEIRKPAPSPACTDTQGSFIEFAGMESACTVPRTTGEQPLGCDDATGASGPETDVGLEAYHRRRARRRQSNRDSARRTRQRRMDELQELQEQVAGLAREKSNLVMANRELQYNCQEMEARNHKNTRQYESMMREHLKVLHDLQILREALKTVPELQMNTMHMREQLLPDMEMPVHHQQPHMLPAMQMGMGHSMYPPPRSATPTGRRPVNM